MNEWNLGKFSVKIKHFTFRTFEQVCKYLCMYVSMYSVYFPLVNIYICNLNVRPSVRSDKIKILRMTSLIFFPIIMDKEIKRKHNYSHKKQDR